MTPAEVWQVSVSGITAYLAGIIGSMKIGLVCPYSIFKGGGVKEYVLALQHGMHARGHDAWIITPQPRNYDGPVPEGVIMVGGSTDMRSPFSTTAQIGASVDIDALETMLEREQFDIMHFHEPWVPILSRQILSRSQAVNIATFHAKLPETMMVKTLVNVVTPYTRSVLNYIDYYTAVSEAAADYVRTLTDEPIRLIPNGVDLKKYERHTFKPVDLPKIRGDIKDMHTVLYVGRLEKRKGVMWLIRAFGELQATMPNVRLVIAGDGVDREKLEAEVASRGLKHVDFLGFITEEEKLNLMRQSDLFCSPAIFGESFGIVLLEAMASGLVTIAGDNAGYRSVLKERGLLSLVDPKDTAEFARRMRLLLIDEDLRRLWKDWAKKYVQQFDYDHIVELYLDLYQELLSAKK